MLKPIKNFLTYLQRNANSSNIFGLTTAPAATTMGPTGGVEEPVARLGETVVLEADELVVEDRDPLCDPLALDDECQDDEVVQHQDSANDSGQLDDETTAAGNIIIVDVSTLKSRIALENGEYGDQLEKEAEQKISPSADQCLLPEEHDEAEGSIYVLPLSDLSSNAESLDRSRDEDTNSAPTADATTGSTAKAASAIVEESIKIPVDSSTDSVVEILPDNGDECVEEALLVEDTTPSLIVTENESFTTVESSMEIDEEEVIDGTEEIPNIQHEDPRDGDQHPRTGEGAEVVQANVPKTGAAQCVNSDMAQTVNRDGAVVVQGTTVVDTLPATTSAGEEEEASDGSDSGLGLEPVSSSHPIAVLDVDLLPPIKSSLKRRSEPIDAEEQGQRGDVAKFEEKGEGATSQKRAKKGICFDGVTVYYFPRMQGFGCVPSQGGCTLGMESQHVHSRRLTLAEHAAEQRKVHRQQLQELNQRSSSSEDSSSDEEPSESGSEAESESYGFLQPVSARQRRALLKAAGVRRIDPSEKDECREIRTSREVCGCTCRGFCNPNTCACSLAGIKCQVDRPSFPCGCTHDSCHNTAGRVEFNPNRVRSHFMHTIMRLSLEDKANEMRQTMQQQTVSNRPPTGLANGSCANEGTVTAPAPKMLLTVDAAASTNSSSSGYLGSASEKNWSSGPVRLPPTTMTIYDGAATAGAGSLHASEHAHALQQLPHQQQLQLQPQQHHLHHPQPTMPYPNDTAVGLAHINSSAHMVPLQSPYHQHPLTHHLSSGQGPSSYQDYYRDYYIGTTSMGMSHLVATPPPLHYYGGYVGPGHNTIDPYQAHQQQMHHQLHQHQQQQQHVAATMAIGQQHLAINDSAALLHHQPLHHGNMLSTGHDRHASSYEINGIDNTLQSNASVVSIHANVTSPATNCSEGPPTDQASIVKQPTVCDSYEVSQVEENEDLKSTLISPPDGSAPENGLSERSTQSAADSSVSIPNSKNPSDTTFFDLTTPNAGNAERLEAINGMLECTRHTASMIQRASLTMTVAAEEDSELRDFCHSPTMPLESVSDDPAESTKPWDQTEHLSSDDEHASCPEALEVPNGTSEPHENEDQMLDGDVAAEYLNGSGLTSAKDAQPDRQETGYQHSNNSSDGTSVVTEPSSILVEKNAPERPSIKSSPVVAVSADELVPVQETDTVANVGESVEATVDPNENLSEIIKNSIVETAVSH